MIGIIVTHNLLHSSKLSQRLETGILGVDIYINDTTLWRSMLGKILQTWTSHQGPKPLHLNWL
jgi:hypothetical protein